jgi:hypothetical protein
MGTSNVTVTRVSTRRGVITRVVFADGASVDFVGPMSKRSAVEQAVALVARNDYAVSR